MDKKELTEQEIRTRYITLAIKNAGWQEHQIREEYQLTAGRIVARHNTCIRDINTIKRADYVLFYNFHTPIAVIEAKDNKHKISDGIQQALGYAEMLNIPFVFSSNGDAFLFHNKYASENEKIEKEISLAEFPSPDTLMDMYKKYNNIDSVKEKQLSSSYYTENDKMPRYYQLNAINNTYNAIINGEKRVFLVMATGTGKTYVAFQIAWRLWKAGIKKRILFLADREALRDQTYTGDFSPFKENMTMVTNRKVDKSYQIYLALYQSITGQEDTKNIFKQFSKDFFDLVIVDECHRGSAKDDSLWREVLEYFDSASQIGLTATPKENKEVSNISYFGEPVYTYSLKQGIEDGFLAPYKVIRVILDKDVEGFRPERNQKDKYGNLIEDREYNDKDFDRTLFLGKRTETVAKYVSDYLKAHNKRMAKTIFFCVNQEHAAFMRQALVNENADMVKINDKYVMQITSDNEEGKNQIENFCNKNSSYPVLVTTSKLLSTGVDTKTVEFIVIDSNINSIIEFKQIIGRGTRLVEEKNKLYFTIIDFRNVTRLFADAAFDGEPLKSEEYDITTKGKKYKFDDETLTAEAAEKEEKNEKPDTSLPLASNEPKKYYVDNVEVSVLKDLVKYLDYNGKLIIESFKDYTRKNIKNKYATLDNFLQAWNSAEKKSIIIDEMEKAGIFMEELKANTKKDLDPFDMLCHIAYDKPPLTKKERIANVKKRNYFAKYGAKVQEVINALLDKYAETDIRNLETIDILKLEPVNKIGNPMYILNTIFKGRKNFENIIKELENEIYAA